MAAAESLPASYNNLPGLRDIRISHHPYASITVTPVIVVTLYRPTRHNAYTHAMVEDLDRVYRLFDQDDRVKCIVMTGYGNFFCAGAELDGGRGLQQRATEHLGNTRDHGGRGSLAIHRCRKPTIGAIQGSAVGIGITLTLPMAIRICSSTAKIGFVFVRRGVAMEAASSYFLPRLIGMSRALHLLTTGLVYSSTDPLLRDLFSEVIEKEKVLPRALEIAVDVAENTSGVVGFMNREMMWHGKGSAEEQHLLDSKIVYENKGSKDREEGVKSFLEKRQARFESSMVHDLPRTWPWYSRVDTRSEETRLGVEEKGRSKL